MLTIRVMSKSEINVSQKELFCNLFISKVILMSDDIFHMALGMNAHEPALLANFSAHQYTLFIGRF